jgi:hypothetical protein
MVPGGQNINPSFKQFRCGVDGDSGAAGGIFSIGDNEIQSLLLAQPGQKFFDGTSARLANYITDKQQFHGPRVTSWLVLASGMGSWAVLDCRPKDWFCFRALQDTLATFGCQRVK